MVSKKMNAVTTLALQLLLFIFLSLLAVAVTYNNKK